MSQGIVGLRLSSSSEYFVFLRMHKCHNSQNTDLFLTSSGDYLWFSRPGSVRATVNNIFENTNVTQELVDQSIKNAINNSNTNGLLAGATFEGKTLILEENLT